MATAIFIQKGNVIDYTSAKKADYMEIIPFESRIGIALEAIPAGGGTGSVTLTGVYELPAASSLAIEVGDTVYWNKANNTIDKTAENGILAGMAVSAKTSAGTSVRVRIG